MALSPDIKHALQKSIQGEIKDDFVSCLLYSTDASIYQIQPIGVVIPRCLDDLSAIVEISIENKIPLLPRGSGSSLGGQAVGEALIIDTSKYLNRIIELNPEECTALVEPGVILHSLNRIAAPHQLMFGPDPASAERATIGGSIACNATGAHSIQYGMTADHLLSVETILSDGETVCFGEVAVESLKNRNERRESRSAKERLTSFALNIHQSHAEAIRHHWPKVWRRASGYNLNYLLPWSPSIPPKWYDASMPYPPLSGGNINLSSLFAGSEGTLGVIRQAKLRLVRRPRYTLLAVLTFDTIAAACDTAPMLLEKDVSAVELIPGEMLRLARSIPAYAQQLGMFPENCAALLVIELSGENLDLLKSKAREFGDDILIAESIPAQNQVWGVRKMGLGILNSLPGDAKPLAFVEDVAVPVEQLGYFVREMEAIMSAHDTYANFYAHASAGCLHIRPVISTKGMQNVERLRSISHQVVALAFQLNGVISGEHGDGIARSEYLEANFGQEIYALFKELKLTADPDNLFNPGKKVNPLPMDDHLRYGSGYRSKPWQPMFDYSRQESLAGAIEMCNGAGVCRKNFGMMCPSFQAMGDEMQSPRGRANLLRALISGRFPVEAFGENAVMEALDLCLACKGCKSECPSGVDIAKLKFDFLYHYYQSHPHRLRDYLFGYIEKVGLLASPIAGITNGLLANPFIRKVNQSVLGLAAERTFPKFTPLKAKAPLKAHATTPKPDVLFLLDSFTRDFHPETGLAGIHVLERCGLTVHILPVRGAGRALTTKGFLDHAKKHAEKLVQSIKEVDPEGRLPLVGVEPSETFMLRDEYLDYFPDNVYVRSLAKRTWLSDEFLIRPDVNGKPFIERLQKKVNNRSVLLHGQCVQKVQPPAEDGCPVGDQATIAMLKHAGYQVEMVDSGCCGMAGSFGYESEHYKLSMQIGEMKLFPAVRIASPETVIAASGTSCRAQIKSGTGREVVHPITLV